MRRLGIGLALLGCVGGQAVAAETLVLEKCHVKGISEQVMCGKLPVAENPQQPEGKHIDLNVVVLPGRSSGATNDPLLILAGGPGQAATEQAAGINRTFRQVRQRRDIVLIDQRGTGKSNPLQCEDVEMDHLGLSLHSGGLDLAAEARKCLEQDMQGHDLSQYSTNQATDDFEAVRKALGYQKYHLYGGSYGTRSGLVYMRRHPDSIASAVLDSVAPMQMTIGLFGQSSERALELLFDDCRANEGCHKAFGDLKSKYVRLVEKLSGEPLKLSVDNPVTGEPATLVLDDDKFLGNVRTALYMTDLRRLLPLVIHEADKGNYKPFLGFYGALNSGPGTGMYMGMTLSILCSEDWSRVTPQALAADNDNYAMKDLTGNLWQQMCSVWPKHDVADDFADPVKSDIPVLLLSGHWDPVTPPAGADEAAKTLTNARHLVAVNGSHTIAFHTCANRLIGEFINEGKLDELDDSCLTKQHPVRFMLNSGTTSL